MSPLDDKARERSSFLVVGRDVPRADAQPKVTGNAQYVADMHLPNMLHAAVLRASLGLSPASEGRQENLPYLRDAGEVVSRTLAGEFQAAFLLNPTPLWQVQAVAESGEVMPQKSTWFPPKVPAGLVYREVDPRGGP